MEITKTSKNKIGMPLVGYGTYQLSVEQAEACVKDAISAGFRHIDSAEGYQNEVGTGRGIKASGIARKDIWVTTKLFPGYTPWGMEEKGYEATIENLKRQLAELQLDYVDLYLIHAPLSKTRLDQWKALVELKKMGLTKHIGVSNYNKDRLEEIRQAGLPMPEVNQVEFHPIMSQPELTKYMDNNSIQKVAYSSLAPLSTWRTEEGQGGKVLAEMKEEAQKVIREIADKLNVTDAKVLLRWGLQHDYTVLTKTSKVSRMQENLDLFDFEISDADMAELDKLNQNQYIAWAASGLNPLETAPALK